jgi:hypothetical protein
VECGGRNGIRRPCRPQRRRIEYSGRRSYFVIGPPDEESADQTALNKQGAQGDTVSPCTSTLAPFDKRPDCPQQTI